MDRDTEVILLALDFYSNVRKGSAGALETSELSKKIREEKVILSKDTEK